jgi:transcription elongation factor Elf1
MKIPQHVAKDVFYRTVRAPEQVKTSSTFLHRGMCPLCNDYKKRMYIKDFGTMILVYCQNCGYSHSVEVFLKENFPIEYRSLKTHIIDSLADGSFAKKEKRSSIVKNMSDEQIDTLLKQYIPRVSFPIMNEQVDSRLERYRAFCVKYLVDRRIPETIFRDFLCIHGGPLAGYIGIPFYNETKSCLIHIQGRLVIPKKNMKQPKYMFLKDVDNGIELKVNLFGVNGE